MEFNTRSLVSELRKTEFVWRYGSNLVPTLNYKFRDRRQLSPKEKNLLDRLNSDGIAFTPVEQIIADQAEFQALDSAARQLLVSRNEEIERLREKADKNEVGSKTFNVELLGTELRFDPKDIFARFALQTPFLNVANAYFGMSAKLRYYNVWNTFASKGSARESQLWHFDREDNYILKIFVYLSDVDEGAGALTYAPETHKKGRLRSIKPEHFLEGGVRRTTDGQMKAVFGKNRWMRAVGGKGTVVFADTRGYHKGGEARTKDRLMYTCMYTSPASQSKNWIRIGETFDRALLNVRQLRALGLI